jgi:hypothetical protein
MISFHHIMTKKSCLEDDDVGSAHDRGCEIVTLVTVFWCAMRSTTPRLESVGAGGKIMHT